MLYVQDFFEFSKVWDVGLSAQRAYYCNGWWKGPRLIGFENDGCCSHLSFLALKIRIDSWKIVLFTAIKASPNERMWDLPTLRMIVGEFAIQAAYECLHRCKGDDLRKVFTSFEDVS
jgi:hypothetical protein